ncbi:MAG: endolytic transglycosylase MltG [Clostridia bacterium]|nr:endolytic transglycosylase MltG [Clostridia bacterium]
MPTATLPPRLPWPSYRLGVLAGLLILVLAICSLGFWFERALGPATPPGEEEVVVKIPRGSSPGQIAERLRQEGLIRSAVVFRIYLRLQGLEESLKAGEYRLSPSLSVPEIADTLASGNVVRHRVTIPEGFTLKQIAARLAEAGLIDPERFWQVAAEAPFDYDFLRDGPPGTQRLEGFLFPDTYYFSKDMTEEEIIAAMLRRFREAFTPEMEARCRELSLTVREAVTLASLVEREAKLDAERPLVSAVFHNRLRLGLKLESCATVQYLLDEPRPVLRAEDLKIPSPYNTYLHVGLPPGPIASPGLASLRAALYPASAPYLYFVANPDGSHTFSRTYSAHLAASRSIRSRSATSSSP